jgi:hypothetical protein
VNARGGQLSDAGRGGGGRAGGRAGGQARAVDAGVSAATIDQPRGWTAQ